MRVYKCMHHSSTTSIILDRNRVSEASQYYKKSEDINNLTISIWTLAKNGLPRLMVLKLLNFKRKEEIRCIGNNNISFTT